MNVDPQEFLDFVVIAGRLYEMQPHVNNSVCRFCGCDEFEHLDDCVWVMARTVLTRRSDDE